jgi:hypothetical protein
VSRLSSLGLLSLKGQCHETFDSGFFHESVSPKPPIIQWGSFKFVRKKILGDIRSSRCTNGVVDTSGKWKKSSIKNLLTLSL